MFAAAFLTVAGIANAETNHEKAGYQHRSESYEQNSGKVTADTTPANAANTVDGKRLPGRDCKFYEGGTRQHTFPQYEIGNPNRPECPSA